MKKTIILTKKGNHLFSFYKDENNFSGVKCWDSNRSFDKNAMEQLHNTASLPFIHKHVAAMPDTHLGCGATIGSVVATKKALIPAAVGVDIGCGMMAIKTNIKSSQLPDDLHTVRLGLETVIPTGFSGHNIDNLPRIVDDYGGNSLRRFKAEVKITKRDTSKIDIKIITQMASLGGGNHFIEICIDESEDVWVMLHSGSRGIGNIIGSYFIDKAKEQMEKWHISLPDKNLAYLPEDTPFFDDYVLALGWAQRYASENRLVMMNLIMEELKNHIPHIDCDVSSMVINCHHNYAVKENHYGQNVWVTRKGAVRARKGDLGIIPGSMGTASYIVEGKGNKESFCSCSHGAGRVMSRKEARKTISLEQHQHAMNGIEARLDKEVIDESPAAYKNIDDVIKAQLDLIEVKHTLHQVLNIKG